MRHVILNRARVRHSLSRGTILILAIKMLAATAAVQAHAAKWVDSQLVPAPRLGGSDHNVDQSAWQPRGVPEISLIPPLPNLDDRAPIPAKSSDATAPAQRDQVQAAQSPDPDQPGAAGILSEVRTGILAHDIGVFDGSEEDGIDINLELYFGSPGLLDPIWSPRPHLGVAVNSAGATSQIYGGVAWDWTFWEPFFVEGTLALAVHDGTLDRERSDNKPLGCRVLFRESASLGARFLERHSISLQLAHISNANICGNNGGLDTFGIKYGYRF